MIRSSAHTPAAEWRRARRRSRTGAAALVAVAMLVAAGCGGDDDSDGGGDSGTKVPKAEVGTITPPKADADLTEDLGSAATTLSDAGCSYGVFTEEPADHVDEDELEFGTFPPTSGTHIQDWAPFGLYDEQVPDGYAVHNLEHGGVIVWLGTEVDDATRDAVADLLDDEEKWLVMPREDIPGLYSAAWAKGLSCPPDALAKLGPDGIAEALDTWYETVVSTGSEAEKDLPAYAGSLKEPTPERDISADSPF